MAQTLQTLYSEKKSQSELDKKKLKKLQDVEQDKLLHGWRFFKLNNRTSVLIPCDRKGNPTKEGKEKLESYRSL